MKKTSTTLIVCIIAAALVLAGFSIVKDNQVQASQDGTSAKKMVILFDEAE